MDRITPESLHSMSTEEFLRFAETLSGNRRTIGFRARCVTDTELFARQFFPHHCRRPPSTFHLEILKRQNQLDTGRDMTRRTGNRLAIAAPRGSAKTTLCSLLLLLHDILYERERYVVIISATLKQAVQRLRNLRREVTSNKALLEVFASELARTGEFRSQSIHLNGVQVDAFGSGAEIRGISSGPWRPTKIILDDVEDSEGVESPVQREKLRDWFNEVVENLGDTYTNLVIVGTILHPESLLSELLKRPDFDARLFRSVETFSPRHDLWAEWQRRFVNLGDPRRVAAARRYFNRHREAMLEGTRVLWPEREDYYDLMVQLVTHGRRAFYQEKQNEPLGRASALFDPSAVRRFRREGEALMIVERATGIFAVAANADAIGSGGAASGGPASSRSAKSAALASSPRVSLEGFHVVGFLDPALGRGSGERGRSGHGDFAALAVVGTPGDGSFYLLDLWVRQATPLVQIRTAFDFHERWKFTFFGVEGNCFQELLRHPVEEERDTRRRDGRPCDLPVEMITHRRNKVERIAALEPLISNGWLAFSDSLPEEFWRELQTFPGGDHDDALDALEGAVDLARRWGSGPRSIQRVTSGAGRPPRGLQEF